VLLTSPSEAQPVPPRCTALGDAPGWCLDEAAIRAADDAEARLPAVERQRDALRVEVRAVEARLALAASDRLVLSRALESQSAVLAAVRQELRAVRPWLPSWAWLGLGAVLGVVGSVVLALSL